MHYVNKDKRLDEWLPEGALQPSASHEATMTSNGSARKRKRGSVEREKSAGAASKASPGPSDARPGSIGPGTSVPQSITEEEYDIQHHKQITAKRNFDKVVFGRWQIKTWSVFAPVGCQHSSLANPAFRYFSPYPLTESEAEDQVVAPTSQGSTSAPRIPGVARSSFRSHGRTSDLLAGGLGRNSVGSEKAMLWVCDRCFKYMAEGLSWELHMVRLNIRFLLFCQRCAVS